MKILQASFAVAINQFERTCKVFNEIKTVSEELHYLCRLNIFYLKIFIKMKKILFLITALLLSAGISKAQDVYFAGHSTPDSLGNASAMVWKNNTLVYSWFDANAKPTINDMFVTENGDVFCAGHTTDTTNSATGTVWKNGEVFLTADESSVFNKMIVNGEDIITAGYTKDANGQCHAAIWQNGELLYMPSGTMTDHSAINAIAMDEEGNIYSAGYVPYPSNTLIWKNDEVFLELNSISDINDLIYSDGDVFSAGYVNANGFTIADIWQNDSLIYRDDSGSMFSAINSICKSGDDIFAAGYIDTTLIVLQNGEAFYEIPYTGFPAEDYSRIHQLCISDTNLYFTGCLNGEGVIWKDGEILYQPEDCSDIIGIAFIPECDGETRTLPWTDDFEEVTTDWGCWSVLDFDGNNEITWERNTELAQSGDFSARHLACDNIQEGWLITPPIYLQPNRDSTWMSFNTMETNAESYTYSGVWVSTTGTETNNFAEIWSQENPSENWDTININLSDYQGEVVYLAFKYSGHHGHDWYIDDVTLNETYTLRDTIAEFPYVENFENGLGDWYIIDEDHSGKQHNWKLMEFGLDSEYCLGHDHGTIETYQKSWAISRPLHFDVDMFYTLRYWNKINGLSSRDHSGIYVADNTGHTPVPTDFVPLFENDGNTSDWAENEINLNEYAGHDIYLAFGYEGYDHDWLIDSITLESRIAEYTIEVVSDHPAWGYVVGGGIYPIYDTIQIEAIPYEGFAFNKWDDACTSNPRTVIVNGNQTFTAQFGVRQCVILTEVTPEGAGSVDGGGIFDYGTTIQLFARANAGYQFEQWSDGVTENPRTVIVDGDQIFTAQFGIQQCVILTEVTPEGSGIVDGGGLFDYGTTIHLFAKANPGHQFTRWDDGETANPRTAVVTGDAVYVAEFLTFQYEITATASPEEGGSISGTGTYYYGERAELQATPNENYIFLCWSDGIASNPRIVNVTQDATFTALFHTNGTPEYEITVISDNPILGTVTGGGIYPEGAPVQISANASSNARFTHWDDGNTENPREIEVTGNMTFIAYFEAIPTYTITVVSENPLMGTVYGGGVHQEGEVIQIGALPRENFLFDSWQDGDTINPRSITVTEDAYYMAYFDVVPMPTFDITIHYDETQGFVLGTGTYVAGTAATIAAIPADGYQFIKWSDGNTENPRKILVDHDIVLTVFFNEASVDEAYGSMISMFPNPTNGKIHILGLEVVNEIEIFNAFGTLLMKKQMAGDTEIDVSGLASGFYVIRIGKCFGKFVKE